MNDRTSPEHLPTPSAQRSTPSSRSQMVIASSSSTTAAAVRARARPTLAKRSCAAVPVGLNDITHGLDCVRSVQPKIRTPPHAGKYSAHRAPRPALRLAFGRVREDGGRTQVGRAQNRANRTSVPRCAISALKDAGSSARPSTTNAAAQDAARAGILGFAHSPLAGVYYCQLHLRWNLIYKYAPNYYKEH